MCIISWLNLHICRYSSMVYKNTEIFKDNYMKKLWLILGLASASLSSTVAVAENRAPEYGDLYNVQWCPCNPEEPFDANGSVVLGKTVMCPCDGLYSGFKKGLEEDMRDIRKATEKQLRKFNYFKYYIGMDYNLSKQQAVSSKYTFDDIRFASAPVTVSPENIVDDQDSLSFILGARFTKYIGLEAFYISSYKDNTVSELDNTTLNAYPTGHYMMNQYMTSFDAVGIDLIGYLPMSTYFDFIGSIGMAQYNFENEATFMIFKDDFEHLVEAPIHKKFDEKKWGLRFAAGGQLNIAEGVALRAMYRYTSIKGNFIDEIKEFSVGVRFLF